MRETRDYRDRKDKIETYVNLELGLYKHYKGAIYEVIGVARHSETLDELVVYKATYQNEGENLWVRPLAMFTETIIIDGVEKKRFEKV